MGLGFLGELEAADGLQLLVAFMVASAGAVAEAPLDDRFPAVQAKPRKRSSGDLSILQLHVEKGVSQSLSFVSKVYGHVEPLVGWIRLIV